MTSQEIERLPLSPGLLNARELSSLDAVAKRAANTGLVPRALQKKPDDVLLVMVTGREMGFRGPMAALSHLYPIEGRICPSAQTMTGLAERAGHELWVEERTSERCVAAGVRRGSKRIQRVTYTLEDARRAGLLDRWVEKKIQGQGDQYARLHKYVVGNDLALDEEKIAKAPDWAKPLIEAGSLKCKENWAKYPAEMCQARALSALCRMAFSDALLGLEPMTPEELGADEYLDVEPETFTEQARPDDEDDIVDGEIVEDDQDVEGGHDADRVRAAAPPLDAEPSPTGDREGGEAAADVPAPDGSPTSAGGGDSEDGHGKPAASEATTGDSKSEAKENPYARAVHILASELGLADELVDEILNETVGSVSANAVTRDNYGPVIERMREAAGKAS